MFTRFSRFNDPGLAFAKPSLVQPQYQRDTDINYMVKRYVAGDMSVFARHATFGEVDVSSSPSSLHAVMNKVADASTAWAELPRSVRHAFGNVDNFIAYLDNANKPVSEVKPSESVKSDTSVTSPDGEADKA